MSADLGGGDLAPAVAAHAARFAASRTRCTAGSNRAINIPTMAMTTSSSTSVKPARRLEYIFVFIGARQNNGRRDGLHDFNGRRRVEAVPIGAGQAHSCHSTATDLRPPCPG